MRTGKFCCKTTDIMRYKALKQQRELKLKNN